MLLYSDHRIQLKFWANTIRDASMDPRGRTKLIMSSLISTWCKRVEVPMTLSEIEKKATRLLCLTTMRQSPSQINRHKQVRLAAEAE